ncbi:hypothetical protein [Candidatus Electronema sp. PJ]|uniref:hypothetical protein n=1 Tax=Candidatus Electronema sp. PJ TaxID=3401572 RepID=UPI003AA9C1D1
MIKPICFIAVFFGASCSYWADAACGKGSKTVFHCLTDKGKAIELCDSGRTMDYSFGTPGKKTEIALRVPRNKATTYQWKGYGRTHCYSVEIPNGNTTYSIFWHLDTGLVGTEENPESAGVNVEIEKKHVATVKCAENDLNIIQYLEGIDLEPTEE